MNAPVGFWRAAGLLARLRLRRIVNQFRAMSRYRKASQDPKMANRASPFRGVFSLLVLVFMFISFVQVSYTSITNVEQGAAAAQAGSRDSNGTDRAGPSQQHVQPAPGSVMEARALQGLTIVATLVLLGVLLTAVASVELTKPEWDLEWLVTLPLPLPTLIGSMLVERTVANVFGVIFLGAFLLALAMVCGYGFAAPLPALGLTLVLMFLMATVQILADTGLRLSLPPARLRNIQAVVGLVASLPIFLVLWLQSSANAGLLDRVPVPYDWAKWLPGGLMVQAVAAADVWQFMRWSAVLVAEVVAVVVIGSMLIFLQLRNGVVAAGTREGAARRPRPVPQPRAVTAARPRWRSLLPAVQRRDLRLLARDRALLTQTFVLPVILVGMQVTVGPGNESLRSLEPTSAVAAVAFYLGAFTLMQPSFRVLASEGQALWVLYTLPHSLADVVLQKAKLWATVALVFPVVIFAIVAVKAHHVPAAFIMSGIVVLLGVPIFALIGASLGVFAFDPLAQEEQRRVRPTHVYLYMVLGAFYAYAIFVPGIWQRLGLMILMALTAMAMWQKARDQFDYLLDPSASPPPRVSLSDGLIAALTFFVIQGVIVAIPTLGAKVPLSGFIIWIAFTAAGAITYGMVRLFYWRARTQGIPVLVGGGPRAWRLNILWGVLGGAAAAVVGIGYLDVISAMGLLPSPRANPIADPALPYWLAALMIVAAPLFEEFIFRGLIFGGLRRSLGLPVAALASAAIFGLVHPALSVIPVSIMGLAAALAYERTGALMAPMLVHALYNAAIFVFQWSAMHGWR
jgi:membrane protease YdiL (CAAX protease family)